MSVVIAAKFPWPPENPLKINDKPFVFLLTDTRVSDDKGRKLQPDAPKEFRLAKNLTVGYTSSNLNALTEALYKKGYEPSTKEITSIASKRDIKRLGKLIESEHTKHGGFSEIIAVFWDQITKTPNIYELMPNSYIPKELHGIVGIGQKEVLDKFEELSLEDLYYQLRIFNTKGLNKDLGDVFCTLMTNYFIDAIEQSANYSVGLPIQATKITETAMKAWHVKLLKSKAKKFVNLTADNTKLGLPKSVIHTPEYSFGSRHSIQILKNKHFLHPKFQEEELSIVLKYQNNFALKFKGLIIDNFFYLAENGTPFSHEKIHIGNIDNKKRIASLTGGINQLKWQNQKINNKAICKELIIDLELIHEKQRNFTIDIWAINKNQQTLLNELIKGSDYQGIDILSYKHSDKTNPIILLLLWNLNLNSVANLEKAMASHT